MLEYGLAVELVGGVSYQGERMTTHDVSCTIGYPIGTSGNRAPHLSCVLVWLLKQHHRSHLPGGLSGLWRRAP
jgi:hypothetical protein